VSYNVITEAPQYTIDSLQSLANIPLNANGRSNIFGSLATMRREVGNATLTHSNAQTTALTNERNAVSIARRRMAASVALIKALGGGWDTSALPTDEQIVHPSSPASDAAAHG
jgi:hypothetical protein